MIYVVYAHNINWNQYLIVKKIIYSIKERTRDIELKSLANLYVENSTKIEEGQWA